VKTNKKRIRKKYKIQKPWNKQMIPGDHKLAFYRDSKSGHPYMRISKHRNYYYGHEMTSHPSLRNNRTPRSGYISFRRNPNPTNKERSYYHKSIRRLMVVVNNANRFRAHITWAISKRDMKKLKRIDRKRIKSIK